jgi:DNA-binding CsgD family transcriptional regulator
MIEPGRRLTQREREVAEGLCTGDAPRRIAQQLRISPETVRKHRASIYRKLGIGSITQLIATLGPRCEVFILRC